MLRTKIVILTLIMVSIFFSHGWMEDNCSALASPTTISGLLEGPYGTIAGAIVRVPATSISTTTNSEGKFILQDLTPGTKVPVTAWAPGYFIGGGQKYLPGTTEVIITLSPHPVVDNPDYDWQSAYLESGHDLTCEKCHSEPESESNGLPFDQWIRDAHSKSAKNIRFLTMYNGTDINGKQSPRTRYIYHKDYGRIPLRPDPKLPYYGPGYKLDFIKTDGNCAACHLPAASIDDAYSTDPNKIGGVGEEGIACDFCHKILNIKLSRSTGLPLQGMPGVLSYEYRRPPEGHQFFAGPFDDVAVGEDIFSPLQLKSQYCAGCHFGVFWNTVIYNSYGEWLASPYSDPSYEKAATCQDCHMPKGASDHFATLEAGGYIREPKTIATHLMLGTGDKEFMKQAASLDMKTSYQGRLVNVQVRVINDRTGHHLPTDSPLRNVLLIVSGTDSAGNPLTRPNGPILPWWAGDYAGNPGRGFARILEELWTEVSPTGAYWNPVRELSDTRLPALSQDLSNYTFIPNTDGPVTIEARLIFRRSFQHLANWKGWKVSDLEIARVSRTLY